MDALNPQFTYEVVRYVPEPWFVMLVTFISFALLIAPLFSLNKRFMSMSIGASILIFLSGSPYILGMFPYVLTGYFVSVGAVLLMLVSSGVLNVRWAR